MTAAPVFAYGKVILLGEHAVVHGQPALAAAIDRGVAARGRPLETAEGRDDRLSVAPWGVDLRVGPTAPEPSADAALARAFAAILDGFGERRPRVAVDATVGIPGGAGLGCSAALGVAVLGAVEAALDRPSTAADRATRSLVWERVFHGNPSGVDNAAAAMGGVIWFRRGQPPTRFDPARRLSIVVAHSGDAASTKRMVDGVAARLEGDGADDARRAVERLGALATGGRGDLEDGDLPRFGARLDEAHGHLRFLGVSTPRLDELCEAARGAGALGAKLTGAGGGGCMLALAPDPAAADRIRERLVGQHGVDDAQAFVAGIGGSAS